MTRLPWLVAGAAALPALAAVVIAAVPSLAFAYRSPELHAGIETAAAVIAILAAYLVAGRFQLSGSLRDLALVVALGAIAVGTLAFSTVPALAGAETTYFTTWTPVVSRLVGALAIAVAAFLPDVRLPRPQRGGWAVVLVVVGVLGGVAVVVALLGSRLPTSFGAGLTPEASNEIRLTDAPAGVVTLQILALALYSAAAAGFFVRARRSGEELLGWFAIAAALSAGSRLHYALFPAVNPEWVFSGDVVRLTFFLALLLGALREIRAYQRRIAVAAALEERRRVARDLHDVLAQDLAFISMHVRRLGNGNPQRVAEVRAAADRALDESRTAIRVLTRRADDPFHAEIEEVAAQIAGRAGARLRLNLDPRVEVPPEDREELLRILREAMNNGVRHGGATEVSVRLTGEDGIRLEVRDDGEGFDPDQPARAGSFGLTSMRERAVSLGGHLELDSKPGEGTRVEVVLP